MQVKGIVAAVVAALLVLLFFGTYYTVAPYEGAVLTRFGQFVAVEGEGLHFKVPLVNSVTFYRTDIQELTPKQPANTYTVDNQEVDVIWKVFYRVRPERIEFVYRNVQDYQARLDSLVVDRLKAAMGTINVQHVAEKRGSIRDQIKATIATAAIDLGIEVTDFQLANLEYTKSFRAAVEMAAAAKAMVETREQERLQAEKTADRVRIEAQGKADAYLFERRAEASGIELKGKAEASAIEARQKALSQNSALVELEKAQRWNGQLPTQVLSGVMPFMNIDRPGAALTSR